VLNRISFSGTVDSGGYSEGAFRGRFTDSSIRRIVPLGALLEDVKSTHADYREVIHTRGDKVFLFLDPPYLTATQSRLYGLNGTLHTLFNHDEFAAEMKKCRYKWLITYDDAKEIRERFDFAYQDEWQLQYGMNNFGRDYAPKGKELFITNYVSQPQRAAQIRLLEQKSSYKLKTNTVNKDHP
jgi:DNA adenine methylase